MGQKRARGAACGVVVFSLGLVLSAVSAPVASAAPRGAIAPTSLPPDCVGDLTVVSCTFRYDGTTGADGTSQAFTVPEGVGQITIEAWGAQGGTAIPVGDPFDPPIVGGLGGYAKGTVPVMPGEILLVTVGGQPTGTAGGFNGGGAAGPATAENYGEAGGGATDARLGGDGLADRMVVAGGGGGAAGNNDEEHGSVPGGAGGGITGAPTSCSGSPCGTGGTATVGGAAGSPGSPCVIAGSLGQGGSGCGGGGGGGYYGGGGGAFDPGSGPASPPIDGDGGGGSAYISPSATAASTVGGVQSGNGMLRISYTTTDSFPGLRWSAPRRIDTTTEPLSAVSCADGNFCMAVDGVGQAIDYDGHWLKPVKVAHGVLSAVSCPSRIFCVAVGSVHHGNGPLISVDNHGTWSSSSGPVAGASETLTGVSCASARFCVASGTYWQGGAPGTTAFVQTFDGRSWTVVLNPDLTGYGSGDSMTGVDCTSTSFCVAVGVAGDRGDVGGLVDTDTDGTWSGTQISDDRTLGGFGDTVGLSAIACPAVNSCLAAGPSGYAYSNHGSGWTVGIGDPQSSVTAISCPDVSTCLAVDGAGNVLVNEKGDWEVARPIDPGQVLMSVSCPTTGFCATVDAAGRALLGRR